MDNILVIGGVAAGLSAASRARRLSASAAITVLERGSQAAYSACGLPYFLAGRIRHLDALRVHPAAWFREHRQLNLLLGHEALAIEPGRRRVRVRSAEGEGWLAYDRLVIATGARSRWQVACHFLPGSLPLAARSARFDPRPRTPAGAEGVSPLPQPETALRNIFAANTWEQVQELEAALRSGEIKRIAVAGGGYIGVETAEALAQRGLQVALVHAHAALLRGFDAELAADVPDRLAALGIELHLGCRVLAVSGARGGRVLGLETSSGPIACDAVVNCGGLRPEVSLAAAAGVALGPSGAIAVDERQQTSLPGIFAAGDCAETRHLVTSAPVWVPLGAAANKQGRVAGANAAHTGSPARFPGVLATLAIPVAGHHYGRTGLSLEQARASGFDAAAVLVQAASKAGYLDAQPLAVRIIYQPSTGRLLGAHFRGAPGTVAGRLDTAAACLAARMTLEQIEYLDLAYSPALAPLYEPLLIAAHNARQT